MTDENEKELNDLLMEKFNCAKQQRELARQIAELEARSTELQVRIVAAQNRANG